MNRSIKWYFSLFPLSFPSSPSQQLSFHSLESPYIPVVRSHSWLPFPSAASVENTLQTNTHGRGYVHQRPCNSTSFLLILPPPFLGSNRYRSSRWFNQGSMVVCFAWGPDPSGNVLQVLLAGFWTDGRYARPPTPPIQYHQKKDFQSVWADRKVILCFHCAGLCLIKKWFLAAEWSRAYKIKTNNIDCN